MNALLSLLDFQLVLILFFQQLISKKVSAIRADCFVPNVVQSTSRTVQTRETPLFYDELVRSHAAWNYVIWCIALEIYSHENRKILTVKGLHSLANSVLPMFRSVLCSCGLHLWYMVHANVLWANK